MDNTSIGIKHHAEYSGPCGLPTDRHLEKHISDFKIKLTTTGVKSRPPHCDRQAQFLSSASNRKLWVKNCADLQTLSTKLALKSSIDPTVQKDFISFLSCHSHCATLFHQGTNIFGATICSFDLSTSKGGGEDSVSPRWYFSSRGDPLLFDSSLTASVPVRSSTSTTSHSARSTKQRTVKTLHYHHWLPSCHWIHESHPTAFQTCVGRVATPH